MQQVRAEAVVIGMTGKGECFLKCPVLDKEYFLLPILKLLEMGFWDFDSVPAAVSDQISAWEWFISLEEGERWKSKISAGISPFWFRFSEIGGDFIVTSMGL